MSDRELRSLRAAIEEKQRNKKRGRFSQDVKRRLVAFVAGRRRAGESVGSIARRLGLSEQTVWSWRDAWEKKDAVVLRQVEVVSETPLPARRMVTLHGPAGTRIEGVSLDEVAELWRKLA